MRVAYIILSNRIHGAENRVINIALNSEEGSDYRINSFLIINHSLYKSAIKRDDLEKKLVANNHKVIVLSDFSWIHSQLRKIVYLSIVLYFILIKRINYLHSYLGAKYLMMPLSLIGRKIIIEITSPDVADSFISNFRQRKYLYKRLYRVNCVTESVFNRIQSNLPNQLKDINLVFMDLPYSNVSTIEYDLIQKKENTIIYASRFIKRKNVIVFAEGVKDFLLKFPGWKVKIFGSGPLELEINQILENEIKSGLLQIGYTNQIVKEFEKSKIIVSLIEPDNYPSQSILEAMANGNALLVSDTGLSYRFLEGNNGCLTSKKTFVEDLINIINDKENLSDMMINSIHFFKANFDQKKYFDELIKKCYK